VRIVQNEIYSCIYFLVEKLVCANESIRLKIFDGASINKLFLSEHRQQNYYYVEELAAEVEIYAALLDL